MAQSCEGLITFFVSNGTEFGQEKNYIFPTELNIFFLCDYSARDRFTHHFI